MNSLFRKEILEQQHAKLKGNIIIPRSLPTSIMVWFLAVIFLIILVFLFLSSYARKETARGYVVPESGVTRLYARSTGIIESIYVREGQHINKGQELLIFSSGIHLSDGTSEKKSLITAIDKQIFETENRINLLSKQNEKDLLTLKSKLRGYEDDLVSNVEHAHIEQKLLNISNKQLKISNKLRKTGVISEIDLMKKQENSFVYQEKIISLTQQQHKIEREIEISKLSIENLPLKTANSASMLQSELSRFKRERTQFELQSGYTLNSPITGYISSILVHAGENVKQSKLLITILPRKSKLQATLFVPTSAIGFIKKQQNVRILLDAFPYQHFGVMNGQVKRVSRTIIMPKEAPIPLSINQPIYQITVELDRQKIFAFGESHPLQAGMLLSAEIILGKRTLVEWLIEPILAIRK